MNNQKRYPVHFHARFVFVMLVLSGACVAHAQQIKHDGYWWASNSESFRLGFITDHATAMTFVGDDLAFSCIAAKSGGTLPEYPSQGVLKACSEAPESVTLDYGHIRMAQFVDGVDQFYKDFRNSNIDIKFAMLYVRDELRATKTDKGLADELTRFRQLANR